MERSASRVFNFPLLGQLEAVVGIDGDGDGAHQTGCLSLDIVGCTLGDADQAKCDGLKMKRKKSVIYTKERSER